MIDVSLTPIFVDYTRMAIGGSTRSVMGQGRVHTISVHWLPGCSLDYVILSVCFQRSTVRPSMEIAQRAVIVNFDDGSSSTNSSSSNSGSGLPYQILLAAYQGRSISSS